MQGKTINNALIALRKQGGSQGLLAEVLLDMRGVQMPLYHQHQPFKRKGAMNATLDALKDGPKTPVEVGDAIHAVKPDLTDRDARNRAYQTLQRLKAKGLVVRDGRVWRLA